MDSDSELGLDLNQELEADLDEEMYGFLDEMETEQLREMNNRICEMLDNRYKDKEREISASLYVGDRVQFKPKKFGTTVEGTIERKNQRTVSLTNCSDGRSWKVYYSNIQKVTL